MDGYASEEALYSDSDNGLQSSVELKRARKKDSNYQNSNYQNSNYQESNYSDPYPSKQQSYQDYTKLPNFQDYTKQPPYPTDDSDSDTPKISLTTPTSRNPSKSPNNSAINDNSSQSHTRSNSSSSPHSPSRRRKSDERLRLRNSEVGAGYTLAPATGRIFRNLLILEDNLRQQVVQQRNLRRKYLTFLAILCLMITSIGHHLIYGDVAGTRRVVLQFVLLALLVTLMLYHLSGEYQKTIVLPRKFLSLTNKGLRQLNVRLVKIKTPWLDLVVDLMREVGLVGAELCLRSLHTVYPLTYLNRALRMERFLRLWQLYCQPRVGINDVKLILNSRAFNTDVREGWEVYRSEFWAHEGVRRRASVLAFTKEKKKKVRTRTKSMKEEKDRREGD